MSSIYGELGRSSGAEGAAYIEVDFDLGHVTYQWRSAKEKMDLRDYSW